MTEHVRMDPWRIRGGELSFGELPLLMGIVNVTPDSFSDGGRYDTVNAAVAQGLRLVEDGADILDIGGESTRPYATPVDVDEELARVVPVVRALAERTRTPISVDTTKSAVAQAALEAGAVIVNDVSGLTFDEKMPEVCRASGAGVVAMHIRGTPQTMQDDPRYDDVVRDVSDWLAARAKSLHDAGIARERLCLDPGIGFGKTPQHNLDLLSHLRTLRSLGYPLLVGHSRKRFIGKIIGRSIDEAVQGTVGIAIAIAQQRAEIIRVHDVRAVRDALLCWRAVVRHIPPTE